MTHFPGVMTHFTRDMTQYPPCVTHFPPDIFLFLKKICHYSFFYFRDKKYDPTYSLQDENSHHGLSLSVRPYRPSYSLGIYAAAATSALSQRLPQHRNTPPIKF
jgi:hypothetical protein